jgi:MFS family permease
MALVGAGLGLIAASDHIIGLLGGLALAGVGLGAFIPANNSSVMSAAPEGRTGLVGGVLNMTRAGGTALGIAVAGALYSAGGLTLTAASLAALGLLVGIALLAGGASESILTGRLGHECGARSGH